MSTAKKATSRLSKALLETANDMHSSGMMNKVVHEKITMRHLGAQAVAEIAPITSDEIKSIRQQANMSQAVFAQHLNLTVGYISQLERGAKRPTGAALALLNVVKRKGIEAIL
jgi:putative transcriptional regulator